MPKFVIKGDIPDLRNVTPDEVIAISQKSASGLNKWNDLGPKIQSLASYVPPKIDCVYIASQDEMAGETCPSWVIPRLIGFPK